MRVSLSGQYGSKSGGIAGELFPQAIQSNSLMSFSHTESTFCFFWITFNLFGHLTEKNMPQTFCHNLISIESVGLRAKCELGHMHDKVSLSTNLHNQVC